MSQKNEEISETLRKIQIRAIEVSTLLKDGKVIVAYEKLGGIIKVVEAIRGKLPSACATAMIGEIKADK